MHYKEHLVCVIYDYILCFKAFCFIDLLNQQQLSKIINNNPLLTILFAINNDME